LNDVFFTFFYDYLAYAIKTRKVYIYTVKQMVLGSPRSWATSWATDRLVRFTRKTIVCENTCLEKHIKKKLGNELGNEIGQY
jgi:hypothetical protein